MAEPHRFYPARWWELRENNRIKCLLCLRECDIAPGDCGFCAVRKNIDGELVSLSYGRPVAMHIDPIEKKPLAHFMPGTTTFSLGTFGCNLNCLFCQNGALSRGRYGSPGQARYVSPEEIVSAAVDQGCRSVAFTYNEPTVFAEYAIDVAKLAHQHNLATVLVSNGYISSAAATELFAHIDAANIDMKGFSEEFYRTMTQASLAPVLASIKLLYDMGKHLELTNLVIPEKNDSPQMIDDWLQWVEDNLDKDVPLHFSAFFPAHHYFDSPRTPRETLFAIRKQAIAAGFTSVHLGNIS